MKVIPAGIGWKALPGRQWEVTIRREPEVIYELGDYPELSALGCHTEGAGVRSAPPGRFVGSPLRLGVIGILKCAAPAPMTSPRIPAAGQAYHRIA